MKLTSKEGIGAITEALRAGLVPMLHGSPGSSKSSIAREIAKNKNLLVIDFRVSTKSPEDFSGFPFPNREEKKAEYMPFNTFPTESDQIPDGYSGWLLLLEEINSAPLSVQAACYQLILDRAVGQDKLHKNVYMVACGNLSTDKAIVNRMGTAMQSRLIHIEIALTATEWIDWANKNHLDHRVISFIGAFPKLLDHFNPDHSDYTFTCGRTWEFVSKLIKPWKKLNHNIGKSLIQGAVGIGPATEFIAFCDMYKKLPKLEEIVNNPDKTEVPDEPSINYAISGMLREYVNASNISNIFIYINRMPIEFQVITIKAMLKAKPEIRGGKEWDEWLTKNAELLM